MRIDLNGDVGESPEPSNLDLAFLDLLTSCNVACGYHAGSPTGIRLTIERAVTAGIRVGAHPSYDDRDGFGRTRIDMDAHDLSSLVAIQVAGIKGLVEGCGGILHHVKPHGALYNTAAVDPDVAAAVVAGIRAVTNACIVYAPPGSCLSTSAAAAGFETMIEAFADRRYDRSGRLVDRAIPGAVMDEPEDVAHQACGIVCEGRLRTIEGEWLAIAPETLCFHGERPGAVERLVRTRDRLIAAGVVIG